jgi:hypothetical protein
MADQTIDQLINKALPVDADKLYIGAAEGDRQSTISNLKDVFGEALKELNYVANVDTYPSTVSTVAPDGAVSVTNELVNVSWNGNGLGAPALLYSVTDLTWDKTSSKRITIEQNQLVGAVQDAPFIALTTHPENLSSDFVEIFTSVPPGGFSSGNVTPTEALILFAVTSAGPAGVGAICLFWEALAPSVSQQVQLITTESIGAKHTLYLSINDTISSPNPDLLLTILSQGTPSEGIPNVNTNQNLGAIGNFTLCLGALAFDDSVAGSMSFDANYIFGNPVGSPTGSLHSESSFTPFPSVSAPVLKAGVYQSGSQQEINGTALEIGDVFAVLTDNSTAVKLSSEDVSTLLTPATHILYTPNAEDALGSYGNVTETANAYTANSFEEAVAKSKAAGRIPIVIDTNIREPAGADLVQPRIKSFNDGSPSVYDLTNITVYTWDAWIRREYATVASIDIVESAILVDKGVVLGYMTEAVAPSLTTSYTDDFPLIGGNQVHGWIGFNNFRDTNSAMDDELPDTGNPAQGGANATSPSLFKIYSNQQASPLAGIKQTFILWGSSLDNHGSIPDSDAAYSTHFIEIYTNDVQGAFIQNDITIDLQANEFLNGNMPIKITHDGRTDNAPPPGTGDINVLFKIKTITDQAIFNASPFEGINTNVPIGDNKLILVLSIQEVAPDLVLTQAGTTQLGLMFEPRDNTIIEINDINTTEVGWNSTSSRTKTIIKRGEGRLHVANVSNTLNPIVIQSNCNRNESGITWWAGGGTFNVTHQDTLNTHTIPLATPSTDGLMSAADKAKLDALP